MIHRTEGDTIQEMNRNTESMIETERGGYYTRVSNTRKRHTIRTKERNMEQSNEMFWTHGKDIHEHMCLKSKHTQLKVEEISRQVFRFYRFAAW